LGYAPQFIQLWQRARHQVAVPHGHRAVLTIGSEVSLWQPLLLDWVSWMRTTMPDVALRVHVDVPQDLIKLVAAGLVDAAIMYAPQHRPGLVIDRLLEETLVLVTSSADARAGRQREYVHVDWGPDIALPSAYAEPGSPLVFNLGPLALNYVLANGGSGYFRMRAVQPYLTSGELELVAGAPQFSYPIYVVYADSADKSVLHPTVAGLRQLSTRELTS
jgi:DNA-binding transcriptional LysR family regulator